MRKINWTIVIVILVVVAFLIGYGQSLISHQNKNSQCQGKTLQNTTLTDIMPLGNATSSILVEVYSDYQCSACAYYYVNTIKQLIKNYVETDKIKLLYDDLAFEGNRSQWAAEAVHCANDQGKFWAYHDKIMSLRYQTNNTNVYEKESLINIAKELGLDECEFSLCLESGKYTKLVKDNTEQALKKITGTPTTFINGRMVVDDKGENVGAMSYDKLSLKIEEVLKN
jgi:protein-disulfide isomerase